MPAEMNPAGILSSPGKSETLQDRRAGACLSPGPMAEYRSLGDNGVAITKVWLSID